MNVLDGIARMVRAYPGRPAFSCRGRTFTFQELWREVASVSVRLSEQGVAQGDVVCLSRLSMQSHFLAILALARMGAVSSSLPPGVSAEARLGMARRMGARFGLEGDEGSFAAAEGFKVMSEASVREQFHSPTRMPRTVRGLADQPWRINLSSGTTGSHKLIAWTHQQRAQLQHNTMDSFPGGPCERMLVCADLAIGFSLGQALTHLASGGSVILAESASPKAWLPIIDRERPTRMITTTALAGRLVDVVRQNGGRGPLPSLCSIMIGGSAVPPALMGALESLVCPHVVVSYGSTEIGATARSEPWSRLIHPDSAGRVVPWVEAQAVDEEGKVLAAGESGRLRFRSRNQAMSVGYVGDASATAAGYDDGWFYPGDLGSVSDDGFLFLQGRADDRVNVGGVKVDPSRVESDLMTLAGVTDCAVVAVQLPQGRARFAIAVVAGEAFSQEAMVARARTGGVLQPIVVQMKSLPRNDGGKVMRKELVAHIEKMAQLRFRERPQP